MKDPFEAAVEEQESPPESPIPPEEDAAAVADTVDGDEEEGDARSQPPASAPPGAPAAGGGGKGKEEEDEEEEENMDVEFGKIPSGSDPDKMVKMHYFFITCLKFLFLQLLTSITGSQKISIPMTIVVSGIAKMFVGELIETGKLQVLKSNS
ncbi:hypothetical protein B296_00002298 [Ensete ventricosum]|uniref:TAFII28-like protein domain-containing protein n=1 Tax=Ensete ventricosum TaxID=4639 RepID=A0A427A9Y2_ENSVE|nr:hypothetical protein B296_00002298 [Ensete ventricosum]